MSEGSTPEGALPPEQLAKSPTEASIHWLQESWRKLDHYPGLKMAAGTLGLIIGSGFVLSQPDLIRTAVSEGQFFEAALRGIAATGLVAGAGTAFRKITSG